VRHVADVISSIEGAVGDQERLSNEIREISARLRDESAKLEDALAKFKVEGEERRIAPVS